MDKKEGYVYIIYIGGINLIKIGKSINPLYRVIELLRENNSNLEVNYLYSIYDNEKDYSKYTLGIIDIIKTDNYHQLEKDLHKYFKHKKVDYKKEYFNIEIEELKNIDYSKIGNGYIIENSFLDYRGFIDLYDFELIKSLDIIIKRRNIFKNSKLFY